MTSGAYRVNCTNFITVLVNAMELAFVHGKNLKPTKPKRTSIFVSYRVCSLVSVMNYVSGLSSREEWVFLRERYPSPAPDFPAPIKKRKKFINSRDLLVAFIS